MEKPTECRWCKSGVRANGRIIAFRCFTSVVDDCWSQSPECKLKGLEDRIQRAVEVLEGARRYDFIASYMPHMDKRSDGEFLEYEEAEQVIEILKGEDNGQTE